MRVLLVEDDQLLGEGVKAGLVQDGYAVDWVTGGEDALLAVETEGFDLMVLDWNLPDISGITVLRRLRQSGSLLPVLMLTARDTVRDRVTGLDGGADDYLVKPFDLHELTARLRALARRRGGRAAPVLVNGVIALDPSAHGVSVEGVAVEISPKEFAVLQLFMESAGKVVSRARIGETIYGWDDEVESNTLEVFIHHLRRKIPRLRLRTIRGVGYMLEREP